MALTQASAHGKDRGKIADMQHRHFATIATIISRMSADLDLTAWQREAIAGHFARELSATNAKFDSERFLRACQP